jgi:argininosuccinate lyase
MNGIPFREAYRRVAIQIQEGAYLPDQQVIHSHEGSLGNLCNKEIAAKMEQVLNMFHFEKKDRAYQALLMRNDGK